MKLPYSKFNEIVHPPIQVCYVENVKNFIFSGTTLGKKSEKFLSLVWMKIFDSI